MKAVQTFKSNPNSQDLLGGGADKSQGASTFEEGHVRQNDCRGPRGSNRGGTGQAGCPQTAVHAVEGDT